MSISTPFNNSTTIYQILENIGNCKNNTSNTNLKLEKEVVKLIEIIHNTHEEEKKEIKIIIKQLLDEFTQTNNNIIDQKWILQSVLKFVVEIEDEQMLKFLLDKKYGTDLYTADMINDNLLKIAVKKENEQIVKLLIEYGVPINTKFGWTILHFAVRLRNESIIKILMLGLSNTDIKNTKHGYTVLHHAVFRKDDTMMKLLVEHGANIGAIIWFYDIAYRS